MKPLAVFVVVCIGIAMIPDRKQEPIEQPSVVQFEELPIIRTLPVAMTSPAVEDEPKKLEVIEPTSKYDLAYTKAVKEEKPLVCYIGAEWCGPCKQMKREVLKPMENDGEFKDVVLVELDYDKDDICDDLMSGDMIPQMVAYSRVEKTWTRHRIPVGYQSRELVRKLLRKALGK